MGEVAVEGLVPVRRAPRSSLAHQISHRVAVTVRRNHFCQMVLVCVILVCLCVTKTSLQLIAVGWARVECGGKKECG